MQITFLAFHVSGTCHRDSKQVHFEEVFLECLRSGTHLVMLLLRLLLVAATQGKMMMMMNMLEWGHIFLWL